MKIAIPGDFLPAGSLSSAIAKESTGKVCIVAAATAATTTTVRGGTQIERKHSICSVPCRALAVRFGL